MAVKGGHLSCLRGKNKSIRSPDLNNGCPSAVGDGEAAERARLPMAHGLIGPDHWKA